MHHPVAEVTGKDLTLHGVVYDEATAWSRAIAAVVQLMVQVDEVGFQITLKQQLGAGVAFAAPCIIIGTKKVGEKVHIASFVV